MKKTILILSTAALVMTACGGGESNDSSMTKDTTTTAPPNADQAKEEKINIDLEQSKVMWRGYILNIKDHTGTLAFKSGQIKVNGDDIISGGLVVDMSTMVATDDNFDEEHPREGLIGHLSSPDFFDVAKFPTASVIFKGGKEVSLSVRDQTHAEQFSDMTVTVENGKRVFKAKMNFDRQKYGVAFKGPAEDVIINDEIELEVVLVEA